MADQIVGVHHEFEPVEKRRIHDRNHLKRKGINQN